MIYDRGHTPGNKLDMSCNLYIYNIQVYIYIYIYIYIYVISIYQINYA